MAFPSCWTGHFQGVVQLRTWACVEAAVVGSDFGASSPWAVGVRTENTCPEVEVGTEEGSHSRAVEDHVVSPFPVVAECPCVVDHLLRHAYFLPDRAACPEA